MGHYPDRQSRRAACGYILEFNNVGVGSPYDASMDAVMRRTHFDALAPSAPGVFDTLLWNRHGELAECTRGNVALLLNGRWVTSPLRCGLLGGIGRASWLREGRLAAAVVRVGELEQVQALAFVNSLRGWVDAVLDERPTSRSSPGPKTAP